MASEAGRRRGTCSRRPVQAELARRRLPVLRRKRRAGVHRCPGGGSRRAEGARGTRIVRRSLHPAADVLAGPEPGRARAPDRRLHLRARQVLRAGDQGTQSDGARPGRPVPVRAGHPGPRPARPEGGGAAGRRAAQPRAVPGGADLAGQGADHRHHRGPGQQPEDPEVRTAGGPGRRHHPAGHRPGRRRPRQGREQGHSAAHLRHSQVGRVRRAAARGRAGRGGRRLRRPRRQGRQRHCGRGGRRPARPAHARRGLPARQANRRLGRTTTPR